HPRLSSQPERDGQGARRVPQGARDRSPLMTVAAIGALSSLSSITGTQATAGTTSVANSAKAAQGGGASSFASALESASQTGMQADQLASQVATGQVQNIQTFTSAAAKAELTVNLVVALRNRAVEAYQEIMR